jgi:uncharacterized membrane protein YqgA involved in biofilm formation
MTIGPIVNSSAIIVGTVAGAMMGKKIPAQMRSSLLMIFGCASMGLGIALIVKVKLIPPVILALILGYIIGEMARIEDGIERLAGKIRGIVEKFMPKSDSDTSHEEFVDKFVGILVLFCTSGMGIFGAINEGMTGDPSLLIAKALLDLFTAGIFAVTLGYAVATLAVPQFLIQFGLLMAAALILPLTTPTMVADFSACGGLILLATGFRICGIKPFPVANMLPALLIVMPLSGLWMRFMV